MSSIIPQPLSFRELQFGIATTPIELSSLKKIQDASLQKTFPVFPHLFQDVTADQLIDSWNLSIEFFSEYISDYSLQKEFILGYYSPIPQRDCFDS